jgi:hypothetical protein
MNATSDAMPLGRMLAVFLGTLIAGNVALFALTYSLPDLPLPSSTGMIVMMIASMVAGQSVAGRLGRKLRMQEKLVFAVCATVLSLLLAIGALAGLLAFFGIPLTLENASTAVLGQPVPRADIMKFLPWVGLFTVVLSVLVAFLFVGLGVSSQLKALERQATKGK